MKLAIISDIHSNYEACTKALSYIEKLGIDKIICLGDVVGYGANPNECVSLIRSKNISCLMGNHDLCVNDAAMEQDFSERAKIAIRWTRKMLTPENKAFLSTFAYSSVLGDNTFVHATPDNPIEFKYIMSPYEAQEYFEDFATPICWIGHSHRPDIFSKGSTAQKMEKGKRYIVNVGSIGQPRDGDWRLSFGVFDTETWSYDNVRLEYDVMSAKEKIVRAGLPKVLADRILVGY